MSQLPPQFTTTESLRNEISRLLQEIIPVLDAIHTLPFRNLWLEQSPGQEYVQLLIQIEKWMLWFWQKLQQVQLMLRILKIQKNI